MAYERGTPDERFFKRVRMTDGCWIWTGHITKDGYGRLGRRLAYRIAYEEMVGGVPAGLHLDHACHDPATCLGGPMCPHRRCVNPDHLRAVTPQQNNGRSVHAFKTHCVNGHRFDEANTHRDANGRRRCRACWREATAAHRARRSA